MDKLVVFLVGLVVISNSLSMDKHQAGDNLMVTLKSDNGLYLARCNKCGPGAYPDTASVHQSNPSNPWARFKLTFITDNKVSLQADSGKFLTRCNNCWRKGAAYPDSATMHATNLQEYLYWTLEYRNNGKWAIKSNTGKYLARCNNCVAGGAYPNFAFVHEANPDNAWAQWTIEQLLPIGKNVALQSDIGKFLSPCLNCGSGRGSYPYSVTVHQQNTGDGWTHFTLESPSQNKVGFKSLNGKYISRCNNCWRGGSYPDSVFNHVSSLTGNPWAIWTLEWKGGLKWAFKADTGNYLARCNGCIPNSNPPNIAFVHQKNSNNAWAIWKLIKL